MAAPVTIAAPETEMLVLADGPGMADNSALFAMLERAGLLALDSAQSPDRFQLVFAGAAMELQLQPQFPAALNPHCDTQTWRGIGKVSTALPTKAPTLGLRLLRVESDRAGRLRDVQHLCAVAAMIAQLCSAERVFWPPASLWSPVAALVDAVALTEEQDLPPVLHLVAFLPVGNSVQTRGLAHFCGLELRTALSTVLSQQDAVRRLARLAIHAMVVGPLQPGASIAGLVRGETLIFEKAVPMNGVDIVNVEIRRRR